MATSTWIEYRLRQNIRLASGRDITEDIGQALTSERIDRLIELRNEYRENGFDVDVVRISSSTVIEIIEA